MRKAKSGEREEMGRSKAQAAKSSPTKLDYSRFLRIPWLMFKN
jgi:hypothetical protein